MLLGPAAALGAGGKGKPKRSKSPLVYLFSLDGLDRDAVADEGKAPFLSGLIADEAAHGVFFPASRSVMAAETNPNHTSMITGAFPETHGIVGNAFATPGTGPDDDPAPPPPAVRPLSPQVRTRPACRPRRPLRRSSGRPRSAATRPP